MLYNINLSHYSAHAERFGFTIDDKVFNDALDSAIDRGLYVILGGDWGVPIGKVTARLGTVATIDISNKTIESLFDNAPMALSTRMVVTDNVDEINIINTFINIEESERKRDKDETDRQDC